MQKNYQVGSPTADRLKKMFHMKHLKTWSDGGPNEKSKNLKRNGPTADR
jgi:hypothetical protein